MNYAQRELFLITLKQQFSDIFFKFGNIISFLVRIYAVYFFSDIKLKF